MTVIDSGVDDGGAARLSDSLGYLECPAQPRAQGRAVIVVRRTDEQSAPAAVRAADPGAGREAYSISLALSMTFSPAFWPPKMSEPW